MSKKTNLILLAVCMVSLFITCKNTDEITITPFVNPPIPGLDPEYTTFEFDTDRDTIFQFTTGTTIRIPAQAFRYRDGTLATGKVEVQYREFHDVSSVYLAGIPMDYQQNGQSHSFQTAGSFDLRANDKERSLQVDPNKNIGVRMASFESADDYNFYYLNEDARQWDSVGFTKPEINIKKKKLKKKINRMKPSLAFPLNRKYFSFNYNAILDFYLNNDVKKANHAYMKNKLKAYGLGWENIETRTALPIGDRREWASMIVWKNLSKKSFPKWTENLYADVELIQNKTYQLTITSKDSSQIFQTKLLFVMTLKELFAFSPEHWRNNYEDIMAKIQTERERMELMADVYRDFEVRNVGIHNWDRILKMEDRIELAANFTFEQTTHEGLSEPEVFFIPGDNKSIMRYPKAKWNRVPLAPDEAGRFFSLLPGKKVAVFSAANYSKLDFDALQKKPNYTFEMLTVAEVIDSEAKFRELVGM